MGAALELLEINHPSANGPRLVRLSRNIKTVIDLMVHDGAKLTDALETVGITRGAYLKASTKAEFAAYQQEAMRVLRKGEASRTIARAVQLADGAESEHVKLQANTWIAGLENIMPVQRTENVHLHQHVIPGLTVIREGWKAHDQDARVIEGLAHQVRTQPVINRIGKSSPHPEAGTVPPKAEVVPAKRGGRGRAPGGVK